MASMSAEFDPTDQSDLAERQEQNAAEAEKLFRAEAEDWSWLMASAKGRRIVYRLLEQTSVFRTTFDQNQAIAAFNEGKRAVGLSILDRVMTHAADQYTPMCEEAKRA